MSEEPDDISEAETQFRALMRDEKAYAQWAASVRKAWAKTPAGILAIRKWKERSL